MNDQVVPVIRDILNAHYELSGWLSKRHAVATCEHCNNPITVKGYSCQECCEHEPDADEGYHCLNCAKDCSESAMSSAIDRAKDLRKYGDA